MYLIIWYIISIPIAALIVGIIDSYRHEEDVSGAWSIAPFWPLLAVAAVCLVVIHGPYAIGQFIQRLFRSKKDV